MNSSTQAIVVVSVASVGFLVWIYTSFQASVRETETRRMEAEQHSVQAQREDAEKKRKLCDDPARIAEQFLRSANVWPHGGEFTETPRIRCEKTWSCKDMGQNSRLCNVSGTVKYFTAEGKLCSAVSFLTFGYDGFAWFQNDLSFDEKKGPCFDPPAQAAPKKPQQAATPAPTAHAFNGSNTDLVHFRHATTRQ